MTSDPSGGSVGLVIAALLWIALSLGLLVWYLWAMARLFPRLGLNATEGWIPVWNQWKLLGRAGLPGWVVLLGFVGLGIVPFIMLIISMQRLNREHGRGAGLTVLGVFIPPLWAMLLANHIDRGQTSDQRFAPPARSGSNTAASSTAPAPAPQPFMGAVPPLPPVPPVTGLSGPQPVASTTHAANVSETVQVEPIAPVAPPPAAPAASAPGSALGSSPGSASDSAPTLQHLWAASEGVPAAGPLGGDTEAEYQRLAAESFQAPPAVPLGRAATPEPFSWTSATRDPVPPSVLPVPPAPAPAAPETPPAPQPPAPAPAPAPEPAPATTVEPLTTVPAPNPAPMRPTGLTGRFVPLPADGSAPTHDPIVVTESGDDLDRTMIVARDAGFDWVLELPDGERLPLARDSVVGRRPQPFGGATVVVIPDITRTLSKTHARLTHDGTSWIVEDLGSTNGLALLHADGGETELQPRTPARATERMRFGTLTVWLRPGGDAV